MRDPKATGTLSALQFKSTLVTLERLGFALDPILLQCGLTRSAFDNPLARFGAELEHRLWAAIEHATNDPALGLRVGAEFARRGRYELDIYLALHSGTARQAFINLQPLVRLADDRGHIDVNEDAASVTLSVRRDGGYPRAPGALDVMFASCATLLSTRIDGFRLLEASLTRPAPRDARPYFETFGVLPRFGASINAMRFERWLFDVPLCGSDAALGEILLRYVAELVERAPRLDPLLSLVQSALSSGLVQGDTSLSSVARAAGMSPRTLRRRLSELGTSFQGVLDGLRRDFADHYLRDGSASVAEVAERLGFSSTSAFQRAFQRWFGKPPSVYRSEARLALAGVSSHMR